MDAAGPPPAASVDVGGGKSFLGLSTAAEAAFAGAVVLLLVVAAASIAAYLARRRGDKPQSSSSRVDHALSSGSLLPTSTPKQQKYAEVGAEVGTSSSDVASSSAAASSLESPVRKKLERISGGGAAPGVEMGWGSWYELEELEAATGGFREANVVGEGGYGTVYRGVLAGGEVVAVKNLFDHK